MGERGWEREEKGVPTRGDVRVEVVCVSTVSGSWGSGRVQLSFFSQVAAVSASVEAK